jgi:hypothetical protein
LLARLPLDCKHAAEAWHEQQAQTA